MKKAFQVTVRFEPYLTVVATHLIKGFAYLSAWLEYTLCYVVRS